MSVDKRPLGLGIAGLGRAFVAMAPTLARHPGVRVTGAADPRIEARTRFEQQWGAPAHGELSTLLRDPAVEAVYVATPHQHHVEAVERVAAAGRHVLVEKPMALTLAECDRMIVAAERAGVALVVGHTHSFDAAVEAIRAVVDDGRYGSLRMLNGWAYTDFLYRPRRPEELDTARGGGVLFNQAPHHVDMVRYLAGGGVRSVRAATGVWDPARPTEGSYSAFIDFASGVACTLVYSGYAHFDTDEFHDWVGETGRRRDPHEYGAARRLLARCNSPEDEARLKGETGYGGSLPLGRVAGPGCDEVAHDHFGTLIASFDRADVRPTPQGLIVYGDHARETVTLPPHPSGADRGAVLDELVCAVRCGQVPRRDGRWARATLEVCLAMLQSSRERREVVLDAATP